MNTLSYLSQHLFTTFNKQKSHIYDSDHEGNNIDESSIKQESLKSEITPSDSAISDVNIDIPASTKTPGIFSKDESSHNNIDKSQDSDDDSNLVQGKVNPEKENNLSKRNFGEVLITIILFLPNYVLLKPFLFIWFVIMLPLSFIERGIKLRNRSRMKQKETKKTNNIPLVNSGLGAIEETPEEDLSSGEEFYLQRDMVKGSLFKASPIKQDSSKTKSNRLSVNLDTTSHMSSATFGTKKMGRFLFPKKLIPKSTLFAKKKKTLVIDLDETLIHSISRGTTHNNSSQAHIVEVRFASSGISTLYYVYKRPHCDHFLSKVSKWYDIVIFTASMKEYADPVIDWLESSFPGNFNKRLYRSDCTLRDGVGYIKDLSVVFGGKRNSISEDKLNQIIIIDNSPISYAMQVDNAIQVEGWISDPTDVDLLNLIPLLEALRYTTDVRNVLALKSGEKAFHII